MEIKFWWRIDFLSIFKEKMITNYNITCKNSKKYIYIKFKLRSVFSIEILNEKWRY